MRRFTTRRQDGCHAKPGHDITRYHQCWPGFGSHSTDQPSGRAQGQGRGRVGSSKMFPEKHITSNAEYTNTQQGLPGVGYTLARN
jgi:hypothetical protein